MTRSRLQCISRTRISHSYCMCANACRISYFIIKNPSRPRVIDACTCDVSANVHQWCFDISKLSKYRFDIDTSYRIVRGNIEIFDIRVSTFWFIVLQNFHVWCQEVVKFSLKLSLSVKVSMKVSMKVSRLLDTTRENSWRESLNFSLWENFLKFYITTYLSEFLKQ